MRPPVGSIVVSKVVVAASIPHLRMALCTVPVDRFPDGISADRFRPKIICRGSHGRADYPARPGLSVRPASPRPAGSQIYPMHVPVPYATLDSDVCSNRFRSAPATQAPPLVALATPTPGLRASRGAAQHPSHGVPFPRAGLHGPCPAGGQRRSVAGFGGARPVAGGAGQQEPKRHRLCIGPCAGLARGFRCRPLSRSHGRPRRPLRIP